MAVARPSTAPLTATQVAAIDAPASVEAYTRWTEDEQGRTLGQSRLLLSGMYCAACSGLIEDALLRRPGVLSAEVSAAAQRAVVLWDPSVTRVSALIESVQGAGYGAFPDTGTQAVDLAARESRQAMWRLFVAGFCMMQVMMYATPSYIAGPGQITADMAQLMRLASWVLSIPVLVFAAGPFFRGAWSALRERRIGMDVPVALGIAVTFVASSVATFDARGVFANEVYFDSMTMFAAFLLGARMLEMRARRLAAQSLDSVMRRLPDAVERLRADGGVELVVPGELRVGDRLRVQVGQAFAADGRVTEGRTQVDEAMLTGESRPVDRDVGEEVAAGCINLGAPVVVEVLRLGAQTRYQRIVALVERALTERPALLLSADRIAGPFLWGVLLLALVAFLVWWQIDPSRAVWVAVAVLVVTCPCALSLGAPVAMLAAAGELARRGILVQRLDVLEGLTRSTDWVFDKTGTLTQDRLVVAEVVPLAAAPAAARSADWRGVAAALAARSAHPLARAVARQAQADAPWAGGVDEVNEWSGRGVEARIDLGGVAWSCRLGAPAWCGDAEGQSVQRPVVSLAVLDGGRWTPLLRFELDELLRPHARQAVQTLCAGGLQVHLLSGDRAASVEAMSQRLGIAHVHAQCAPDDKLAVVADLQARAAVVTMVGDGINDAPVLARADVSIALGSAAALTQARADVIVLSDRLDDLLMLQRMARRTVRIVRQNLVWALGYNVVSLPLALVGWLPPWLAGIGMAASSLLVVLNALRLMRGNERPADLEVLPASPRTA
ncbi:heavy metal translocating P-type ATPase [Sphaerotilus hippei]|uniref:heavy metal translocating P-type ATPase n=1 Tax=Sphaerotilus hippei TaxID=744406 RepID=UPI001FE42DAA|nr:cation-translocating P-type ATPase [Sphaerotilus hippei]